MKDGISFVKVNYHLFTYSKLRHNNNIIVTFTSSVVTILNNKSNISVILEVPIKEIVMYLVTQHKDTVNDIIGTFTKSANLWITN